MKHLSFFLVISSLVILACSSVTSNKTEDFSSYFYPITGKDTTVFVFSDSRENKISLIVYQKSDTELVKITCGIIEESKEIGFSKKDKVIKDSTNVIIQGISLSGHTTYTDSVLKYPRYNLPEFKDTLVKTQNSFFGPIKIEMFFSWKLKQKTNVDVLGKTTPALVLEQRMEIYQTIQGQRMSSLDSKKEMTYAKNFGLVKLNNLTEGYTYKLIAKTNLPQARKDIKQGKRW